MAVSPVTWIHAEMPPFPPAVVDSKNRPEPVAVSAVKVPRAVRSTEVAARLLNAIPVGVSIKVVAIARAEGAVRLGTAALSRACTC